MGSRHMDPSPFDFSALLVVVERLLGERDGVADRLCQEVDVLTRHRAQLRLHPAGRARNIRAEVAAGAHLYPVEFAGHLYGTLVVMPDSHDPTAPALPEPLARQLARVCGALLCLLDQSALLRALGSHLPPCDPQPLTVRQREVLTLIARGLSDDEITDALHIAPETLRRHRFDMCQRLGVHAAHDLLLAAYQYGLVSYLTPARTPSPPPIAGWR